MNNNILVLVPLPLLSYLLSSSLSSSLSSLLSSLLLLSARDALPTMATPLFPPSASSAMSAAAASAARARAVAAKSHDGGARRNLGLSRPRHLLSAGASPPFASHSPTGCRVACCRVPLPHVPFCRAAASRVQTIATAHPSGVSAVATTPDAPVGFPVRRIVITGAPVKIVMLTTNTRWN